MSTHASGVALADVLNGKDGELKLVRGDSVLLHSDAPPFGLFHPIAAYRKS